MSNPERTDRIREAPRKNKWDLVVCALPMNILLLTGYWPVVGSGVGFTDSIRSELIHDKSDVHITAVMLPAMNTPQFSWCRTRLSRHPQPMPPIFQPEVAARAIVWAASHKRREVMLVGLPSKRFTAMSWFPLTLTVI